MSADEVVRARVDRRVKQKAVHVLADMGLTVSDAIRLLLVRIAAEKALPFRVEVPNAKTLAAMKESDRNNLPRVGSVAELMADLNEDHRVDDSVQARLQAREARRAAQDFGSGSTRVGAAPRRR